MEKTQKTMMRDEINTVWHTPIIVTTVCKNGSERMGAYAACCYTMKKNSRLRIDVQKFGKTKALAKSELLKFLSNGNEYTLIII